MFGIRMVELTMEANREIHKTMLRGVKYTPNLPNNLISIGCLTAAGHVTIFSRTTVIFQTRSRVIFAEGFKTGHMYKMKVKPIQNNINLYPIPSESNDDNIPIPIEGEEMCHQGEQPREAAQSQEAAQPQNEEAGTAQLSNCNESVTMEALCSSKRLAEIPGKDYATLKDLWWKSHTKPTNTAFVSRESNPIIALETIQAKKSHENLEIQEAAMKMEIEQAGHQWNKRFTKELPNLSY